MCLTKTFRGAQIDALPPFPPRALHGAGTRVDVSLLVTKHVDEPQRRAQRHDRRRRPTIDWEFANSYRVTVAKGIDPILMLALTICKDKLEEKKNDG